MLSHRLRRIAPAVLVPLLAAPLLPAAANAATATTARPIVPARHGLPASATSVGRIDAALHASRGPVTVMVELAAPPASVVAASVVAGQTTGSRRQLPARRRAAFTAQRGRITAMQRSLQSHFGAAATRATKLFAVNAVYDGVAVRTDASRLPALAHLAGVKAIHRLVPKHIDNTVTVPLTKAVALWRDNVANGGNTGAGVTVGVIDTGIDYTHADFGGTGTPAAYKTAQAITDTSWTTAKVVGGQDFAGDSYDPSAGLPGSADPNLADETPVPDPNPIDCNGHGTHVAGTAAGYGVTTGGATFGGAGDPSLYTSTANDVPTFESQFSIGPGMAPSATLYALKIFGCGEGGTTSDLISQALDWAAAPDGDPNHHLDVVNMSLGSAFTPPDDPDTVAANNASLAGVTVVASSGNAGDVFNSGGAPGNAERVIGVAASDDSQDIVDGLQVDSPVAAQNPANTPNHAWAAEESDSYPWKSRPAVQGVLARLGAGAFTAPGAANNSDGCDPLNSTDAGLVSGKIAFLDWTDDDASRRCGSATRTDNVVAAGAVGAVFGNDEDVFVAGILGDGTIPAMLTTKTARDAILANLGNPVTVTMTHTLHNQVVLTHANTVDTVAPFSSRGVSNAGLVKPDVSAPGVTVFSAAVGTGKDGVSFSGTSMASPHVAGEAALVLAAHPAWLTDAHTGDTGSNKANVPLQVKAAIMNTAAEPVTCLNAAPATPACVAQNESPNRVGAGRIDAESAAQTQVLAYASNADDAGGVSVAFGRVEVVGTATVTRTRHVTVQNTGTTTVPAYTGSYVSSDTMPGVTIAVTTASSAAIPPSGTQTFTVTLTVTPPSDVNGPISMDRPDPTLDAKPAAFNGQLERSFVADESGRLVFSSTGGPTLVVPAHAAPQHVATMAAPSTVAFGSTGLGSLPLSGTDVFDQGTGNTPTVASVVDVLELQGVSGVLPACAGGAIPPGCTQSSADRSADLQAVGVTSDIPIYTQAGQDPYNGGGSNFFSFPALAYVGVSTQQPWRSPSDLNEYDVLIDANRDGLPDAVLFNTRLLGTDVFIAQLDALLPSRGGFVDGPVLDQELLNGVDPSGIDTYAFNSKVMTLPFTPAALAAVGFDPQRSTRVNYWVQGISGESGMVDTIGDPQRGQQPMSVDLARPAVYASDTDSGLEFPGQCSGLNFCTSTLDADTTGVSLKVVRTLANVAADKPLGVLLLHHNNATASSAQLVKFATGVAGKLGRATAPYGYKNPVTVTVSTTLGTATGAVSVTEGAATLATGTLSNGVAHLTLPIRTVGKHTLAVRYVGDVAHAPSSHALALTVVKAATTTVLTSSGSGTVTLTATTKVVAPGAGGISGAVTFYDNGVKFATVTTKGTARALRRLARGRHVLTASYGGSSTLAASKGTKTLSA